MRITKVLLLLSLSAATSFTTADAAPQQRIAQVEQAVSRLHSEVPNLKMRQDGYRVTCLYGRSFGGGNSPLEAAESFRKRHAQALAVNADDIQLGSSFPNGSSTLPLMYDSDRGEFKFTLVNYRQERSGVPVFRSQLKLLVRNEPGFPLVMATSNLRDLGGFSVDPTRARTDPMAAASSFVDPDSHDTGQPRDSRLVIWAGQPRNPEEPRLAIEFLSNDGEWLYVIDAETEEMLLKESRRLNAEVSGNVSGYATAGMASSACEDDHLVPLPYAYVRVNGAEVCTDVNGDYVTPWMRMYPPVTIESELAGRWFQVGNVGQWTESATANPPDILDFIHNSGRADTAEAAVTAYVEANKVRDFVILHCPAFENLLTEKLTLGVNDAYLGSSGKYVPSGPSIILRAATATESNAAFSSVIYHEFGHHVQWVAGQHIPYSMHEGYADCLALLVSDDPRMGLGLDPTDCQHAIRTADNNMEYPSVEATMHDRGMVFSGCVWDTREALAVTYPDTYMDILAELTLSSIFINLEWYPNPQVFINFITLDDDDGDLSNGTPHYDEIYAGFDAHNMVDDSIETLWVDAVNGNDDTGDGSELLPYQSIQKGIDAAGFQDTVLVLPGTYEKIDLVDKRLVVKSSNGPHATTIQGQVGDTLVTIDHTSGFNEMSRYVEFRGFTLLDGSIGIFCGDASPLVCDNILDGQSVAGIRCFNDNSVTHPLIRNNTVVKGAGVGISMASFDFYSHMVDTVMNNIVAFNDVGIGYDGVDEMGGLILRPLVAYNNVYGNTTADYDDIDYGTGNIESDPEFGAGYTLRLTSPGVDAGNPDSVYNDPDGSRNDMGALPLAQCCFGSRGNVDCDTLDMVDISDVNALIDNLYLTLAPLCCVAEADLDVSGGCNPGPYDIDITDLSILIDHLFGSMAPLPDCASCGGAGKLAAGTALRLTKEFADGFTVLSLDYDKDVRALELKLDATTAPQPANLNSGGLELLTKAKGTYVDIALLDLEGAVMIAPGEVLKLEGDITVKSAIAVDLDGTRRNLEVASRGLLPRDYVFNQNYPNPFNPETVFSFSLPDASQVQLAIYNTLGQKVATVVNDWLSAGDYKITWRGTDNGGGKVASGVYFAKFKAGDYTSTKKLCVLK